MKTLKQRFWAKVDKRGADECWQWTAANNGCGYGQFWNGRKRVYAHRYSWELHNNPISQGDEYHGVCVLHRCDNPGCVNPAHLFIGTQHDNMKDMMGKGRGRYVAHVGQRNGRAKLNENSVREIRKYYKAGGCTQVWLALVYGVTKMAISKVTLKKNWVGVE